MRTQCGLLGVTRSTLDYKPVPESAEDARLMRLLDEIYLRDPCLGTRRLAVTGRAVIIAVGRNKIITFL